jgi:hypothetical protein
LPLFSGDGAIDPKRHLDLLLGMGEFHLIEHDYIIMRLFIHILNGCAYECHTSLPTISIRSFYGIETMFLTMYAPLVAYHTFLMQLTQICLGKGEII